jgi:hypothetical protein
LDLLRRFNLLGYYDTWAKFLLKSGNFKSENSRVVSLRWPQIIFPAGSNRTKKAGITDDEKQRYGFLLMNAIDFRAAALP